MRTEEIVKEVKFNMSTIGLSEKAAQRVSKAKTLAVHRIETYEQYATIGSVAEFEKLKQKNTPVKPVEIKIEEKTLYRCPSCAAILVEKYDTVKRGNISPYCYLCGQALDKGGI